MYSLHTHLLPGRWIERTEGTSAQQSWTRTSIVASALPEIVSVNGRPGAATGQFAHIRRADNAVSLTVDRARSIPLFFGQTPTELHIGDDIDAIVAHLGSAPDDDARAIFRHSGFVTGSRTFFREVRGLEAGESATIDLATGAIESAGPLIQRYHGQRVTSDDDADDQFTQTLSHSLGTMVDMAQGRQLAIPLSGGLDSRLLALGLRDAGYDNLLAFTYGRTEGAEAALSRSVAESLGIEWHFVRYEPNHLARAWAAADTANFVARTHSGTGLPHVQDWYALRELTQDGILADDAIVLPGHTIVGNLHNPEVLSEANPISPERVAALIGDHHFCLQGGLRDPHARSLVGDEIRAFIDEMSFDGSPQACAEAIETFNLRERQAKYINNSVRAYEFFGLDWALPMLDQQFFELWARFDLSLTKDREWYERYVNRVYARVTGGELPLFAPMTSSEATRTQIKTWLARLRLESSAQRLLTTRAVMSHHMALDALIGDMNRASLALDTVRGRMLLGIYADRFLTDTWNPSTHVFDRDRGMGR